MTRETSHLARPRRRLGVVLLSLTMFLLAGTGAWAFWSTLGSGSGTAVAGTLDAPTGVDASSPSGSSSVSVTWTASAGPLTPQGYFVTRTEAGGGGESAAACGTSPVDLEESTSCSDSAPDGTYTYAVTAVFNSWTAQSSQSEPVTVLSSIATTTTLASSNNPSVVGQTVTYTASITPASGEPPTGGTVTFKDGTETIACVGSQSVTAGTATCEISYDTTDTHEITAEYGGYGVHTGSTSYPISQVVNKAGQTIVFTSTAPSSATVGGATYAVTANGGPSENPVTFTSDTTAICTVSGSTVSFVGAGTCTVLADQAGDDNYLAAPQATQSFAVGRGSQTISFTSTAPANATVSGTTYTVTATATSGGAVTFTSATADTCTVSGSTVSFVGAGTCTVNAHQAGDGNYDAASLVQQSFTVGKGSQTVTFVSTAPSGATVGGAAYTVSATSTSGLTVSFTSATADTCTVSGSTVSFVGAGTCTVNAHQAGNGSYDAAPQAQQSFTVGKGSQTVSFTSTAPTNATVSGTTYTVTATATSGSAVTFTSATSGTCTVSGSTVTFVGAGPCTINADQAGNGNYNPAAQVQQSFTVGAAPTKPTGLAISVQSGNKITPTWDVVAGVAYECQTTSGTGAPVGTAWIACTSGVQWNGQNGNRTFYVRATRGGAVSAFESRQFSA